MPKPPRVRKPGKRAADKALPKNPIKTRDIAELNAALQSCFTDYHVERINSEIDEEETIVTARDSQGFSGRFIINLKYGTARRF